MLTLGPHSGPEGHPIPTHEGQDQLSAVGEGHPSMWRMAQRLPCMALVSCGLWPSLAAAEPAPAVDPLAHGRRE